MLCHNNNKGYTLIEVMIAVGISIILIAGASGTYIVQNRSYVAQESVSEINTQSKVSQDLIANELKSAGFGTPSDLNSDPINGITANVSLDDRTWESDSITILGGFRMIGTLWPSGGGPGMACPATISLGSTEVNLEYSGSEGPNMSDKRFISIDGINFAQIENCTLSGNSCTATITIDRALTQNFPLQDTDSDGFCDEGRPVYLVEDVSFCIDYESNLRRIRRNKLPGTCMGIDTSDDDVIAENIEDLQFAFAVDADDDGATDDQNGDLLINGDDFIDGNTITDTSTITATRINILARAKNADANYKQQGNAPSIIENRVHAPTNDDYRRRWLRTVVNMRNR